MDVKLKKNVNVNPLTLSMDIKHIFKNNIEHGFTVISRLKVTYFLSKL